MQKLARPARMLLLGPPGAGKGTQTSRLLKKFDIPALSSGDILRQQIAEKTDVGKTAADIIKQGKLLPDTVMTAVISAELATRHWLAATKTWLLDGFPRTQPQAELLDGILHPSLAGLNFVVELQVPFEVILDRIANRLVHVPSGRVYNLTYNPPKVPGVDDVTGEPLTRRPDDDPEIFRTRLEEYQKLTTPLIEHYRKQGDLVWSVAGDTSDIIYPQLEKEVIRRFGIAP
ncbi:adenylate kinase-domain-containing protein [Limtongia smithiae]|uniref:adenylate kinase-domain-containing protein n=1 Tax=Limtongia smithiae TaxID=1125753 RepID=UPI0034CEEE2D